MSQNEKNEIEIKKKKRN